MRDQSKHSNGDLKALLLSCIVQKIGAGGGANSDDEGEEGSSDEEEESEEEDEGEEEVDFQCN